MIRPDGLLEHAAQLAAGPGRPREADLRRGISAAYYAVFHDLTGRAARHLAGSFRFLGRLRTRFAARGRMARSLDLPSTWSNGPIPWSANPTLRCRRVSRSMDGCSTSQRRTPTSSTACGRSLNCRSSVTRPTTITTPSSQSRTSSRHVKAPDSRASGSVMPGTKHARRCSRAHHLAVRQWRATLNFQVRSDFGGLSYLGVRSPR